jgi:(2Fe-2S) ferredoxin
MKLVVYAGAVWSHCSPVEVERIDVSSHEEAVKALVEWLDWLSPERAERLAYEVLASDECVLERVSRAAPGTSGGRRAVRPESVWRQLLSARRWRRIDAQTTCVVYYSCRR